MPKQGRGGERPPDTEAEQRAAEAHMHQLGQLAAKAMSGAAAQPPPPQSKAKGAAVPVSSSGKGKTKGSGLYSAVPKSPQSAPDAYYTLISNPYSRGIKPTSNKTTESFEEMMASASSNSAFPSLGEARAQLKRGKETERPIEAEPPTKFERVALTQSNLRNIVETAHLSLSPQDGESMERYHTAVAHRIGQLLEKKGGRYHWPA